MKKRSVLIFLVTLILLSFTWVTCSSNEAKRANTDDMKSITSEPVPLIDSELLTESTPEELGIKGTILTEIDKIANQGIEQKAYPGCQILVAVDGKIIYRKSFGNTMYEGGEPVRNDHIYDIASVTKIASSTLALMRLQTLNQFSLDKKLKDYIPEVVDESFGKVLLRDMMAHRAGFTAWIPFYKKTLVKGDLSTTYYREKQEKGFDFQVAKDLWIRNDYSDSIYKRIIDSGITPGNHYEYSDLGYYFVKKIIEKQTGKRNDEFVTDEIYKALGLKNIGYFPQSFAPLGRIVPTENDVAFRKQLIHGYVHDPGAAMLGGAGGHAGLFANATDLAAIMQLFLNKGKAGNKQLLSPEVVDEYTKVQVAGNRRGAGFDKPTFSRKNGPCCDEASAESYGHSGFTGTLAWADPVYKINYVFLSNRVHPNADVNKLAKLGIRTEIQKVIYKAVMQRKQK
jgi:CubicO group peptidase (beta-lactamase class C family)